MDEVCRDRAPLIITRKRDQAVVMLSLADYESLEETAYLLRSPANARRLLEAIESLARGKDKENENQGPSLSAKPEAQRRCCSVA
jgi:antitoxin YefM